MHAMYLSAGLGCCEMMGVRKESNYYEAKYINKLYKIMGETNKRALRYRVGTRIRDF